MVVRWPGSGRSSAVRRSFAALVWRMWGGGRRGASAIPRHRAMASCGAGGRRAILRSPRRPIDEHPSLETEPGRLNGWKEIALHLGKGTRTVQRWEKLYGLPVHRIGREGGEIVFAFRDEIDRWMAATEGQFKGERRRRLPKASRPLVDRARPTSPSEGGPATGAAAGARRVSAGPRASGRVAVVGRRRPRVGARSASRGRRRRRAASAAGQPAAWRMANESLTVFDSSGRAALRAPRSASPCRAARAPTPGPPSTVPRRC